MAYTDRVTSVIEMMVQMVVCVAQRECCKDKKRGDTAKPGKSRVFRGVGEVDRAAKKPFPLRSDTDTFPGESSPWHLYAPRQ